MSKKPRGKSGSAPGAAINTKWEAGLLAAPLNEVIYVLHSEFALSLTIATYPVSYPKTTFLSLLSHF